MKRTRSKLIAHFVVRKADLRHIYALLQRKAAEDNIKNEKNHLQPTITVVSENSIKTEADNDAIFDNDVIDLQKTLSVDFNYANYETKKTISVGLQEIDRSSHLNSFSVSGDDPSWVDATFVELERTFGAMQPQSKLLSRYRWLILIFLAVVIGYSVRELLGVLPTKNNEPPTDWVIYINEHAWLKYPFRAFGYFLLGWFPAAALVGWLGRLWPSIEFDFGPEHLKRRKLLRGRIAVVTTVLLLPVAIEVFKRFVLGWS